MPKIPEHEIKTINDNAMAAISRALKEITFIERMLSDNDYISSRDTKQNIGLLINLKTKIHAESESKIREYRNSEIKIREEEERKKKKKK